MFSNSVDVPVAFFRPLLRSIFLFLKICCYRSFVLIFWNRCDFLLHVGVRAVHHQVQRESVAVKHEESVQWKSGARAFLVLGV